MFSHHQRIHKPSNTLHNVFFYRIQFFLRICTYYLSWNIFITPNIDFTEQDGMLNSQLRCLMCYSNLLYIFCLPIYYDQFFQKYRLMPFTSRNMNDYSTLHNMFHVLRTFLNASLIGRRKLQNYSIMYGLWPI